MLLCLLSFYLKEVGVCLNQGAHGKVSNLTGVGSLLLSCGRARTQTQAAMLGRKRLSLMSHFIGPTWFFYFFKKCFIYFACVLAPVCGG